MHAIVLFGSVNWICTQQCVCASVCVACMSRCKAPGFICLDGGLKALTHIGPCNALLTERRLWIYFTASRCACLFMSFYVAIFLCKCWRTTDGQATTCRGGWGGGAAREGQALWPGLRLTGSEAVKVFASLMFRWFFFKYLPAEIIHAKSVRIFSTFHLLTVYRYCVKCQQINNMRRNMYTLHEYEYMAQWVPWFIVCLCRGLALGMWRTWFTQRRVSGMWTKCRRGPWIICEWVVGSEKIWYGATE